MQLQRFAQERTEQATPKRLEDARRRGEVARSPDVGAAATLLGTTGALLLAAPLSAAVLLVYSRQVLGHLWQGELDDAAVLALLTDAAWTGVRVALPVAAAALLSGVLASVAQVGFLFTLEPLRPRLSRISPLAGLKRICSRRSLVALVKSVFKVAVVAWVIWGAVVGEVHLLSQLAAVPVREAGALVAGLAVRLLGRVALVLLLLALADYAYQRWEFSVGQKMTRQQVKDEHRQTEGSPELRARVRRRQREMAGRRMLQDVKKADVVITNPIHLAVALVYDAQRMAAPEVLARGQGHLARKIREAAERHGIPRVENPPLARALYSGARVGESIPAALYQAVAEVLAMVYRLQGRA